MPEEKNSLLVVDDENINLKVLNQILGAEYTIYTASNGKSAIEKAKEYKPDLIILDIIMPEMDGYETLKEIKKSDDIKHIPVIFITGLSNDMDEEKGLSLNAADYITKPFSATIVKLRVHNQIQIVNQMRTIERLSMMDQLTNLPNRRSFDERLNMEWKVAVRDQTPISILMIDIDKFKHINDTFGHQKGDIVLQEISRIYPKEFKRPSDFAARWGGEEFVALLPHTHAEGSFEIAERIRNVIEDTEIKLGKDTTYKITVSIGVNTVIPSVDASIDAFITNADMALYEAKDTGRNRVVAAKHT
jgi:diguanylate cyclase (GGDEF)-like protein